MRTDKEIEAMIAKGKAFSEEFPTSAFGDDNVANFKRFKKVIELFKKHGIVKAEMLVEEVYEDDEYMDASNTIAWLRGEVDEMY